MPTSIPGTSLYAVDVSPTSTDPQKPAMIAALKLALGVVTGPESAILGNVVEFSAMDGKSIKDSGIKLEIDGSYLDVTSAEGTKSIRMTTR